MADTGVDIDLYADMESEFPTEDSNTGANDSKELKSEGGDDITGGGSSGRAGIEGSDLYDDVLTNSKDEKTSGGSPEKSQRMSSPSSQERQLRGSSALPRRYQVYVGNLTWWTTDADIADAVLSVGVKDFVEVKFYENRANGQSKGFCCVSTDSEPSMRTLMDKLPKKELHGQIPVVTYATKQALNQFEAQSKTRPDPGPPGGSTRPPMGGSGGRFPLSGGFRSGPRPDGRPMSSAPPYGGRPPLLSNPPPRSSDHMRGPPRHHAPPPGSVPVPMQLPPGLPPPVGMPGAPPMPHVLSGPPPMRHVPGMLPPPHAAPILPVGVHVNPAFFPPGGGVPGHPPPGHGLSEVEFEEIMARNRTVSSSAIARAVQDAASNDFASAIETLVTAISLIKQSKVAHDDRCRILINSLQDTLHGIESKSYGSRSRERPRSRERSYHMSVSRRRSHSPREREYRESRRDHHRETYYRERSRSREREPRGEPRDYRREEKYYDDGRSREEYKHSSRESGSRREGESRREGDPRREGESRSERPERPERREDIERGRTERAGEKDLEPRERSRH